MRRLIRWLWKQGIVSTFMTGLFVVLPIMITVAIMGWVGSLVVEWLGPESLFGSLLKSIGLGLLPGQARETVGTLIGWAIVIGGIWFIGAVVKSAARQGVEDSFHRFVNRIPIINTIYRPVSQVVGMLKQDDSSEMKGMRVVYCSFGEGQGGGFLALLVAPEAFRFDGRACHAVYIPTSPIPMSGGIVFVPLEKVTPVEMSVDELMQIYFSLGVMAPKVVPQQYHAA